ncbi:hypothetical protein HID58_014859 [Brassica napus]|uniref:(rape) hypothetical protein n=1 Tax=Brassica napus TaxID=3708 RepID=A0A817B3R2_BRANA|nr:hypothetical protein HID58_014859 [Brassica napus]CAF2271716.1 unnamed protein product [Brassica napus]
MPSYSLTCLMLVDNGICCVHEFDKPFSKTSKLQGFIKTGQLGAHVGQGLEQSKKHFSDEFNQFCDRTMSDVVWMLCWNRVWPETLLQAFVGGVEKCLVKSVNPGLQIFRVEKDYRFDLVYMEATGGDRFKDLI